MKKRRKRTIGIPDVVAGLRQTNRLLAAVIVQIARTQSRSADYHISALKGVGLRSRQIAEAIGTTEDAVNVTHARAKRRRAVAESPTKAKRAVTPAASEAP